MEVQGQCIESYNRRTFLISFPKAYLRCGHKYTRRMPNDFVPFERVIDVELIGKGQPATAIIRERKKESEPNLLLSSIFHLALQ